PSIPSNRFSSCSVVAPTTTTTTTSTTTTSTTQPPNSKAVKYFSSGFEAPVTLSVKNSNGNTDQYLRGGDFPIGRWAGDDVWDSWVLTIVGNNNPAPTTDYILNSLKTVTSRHNTPTRAFSILMKGD